MIPFAAQNTAETHNAFQWAGQLPKLTLPVWHLDLTDSPNERCLGLTWVCGTLTGSASFAQLTHVPNTHNRSIHRHTDHTMCDSCSNRPHLCTACRQCGLRIRKWNCWTDSILSRSLPATPPSASPGWPLLPFNPGVPGRPGSPSRPSRPIQQT